MIVDGAALERSPEKVFNICVVGSGVAGITLARELASTSVSVCILQGGGLEYDQGSQSLCKDEVFGHQYQDLDACLLRYYGGTTNHWGGYCSPLEDYSFDSQSWIPFSGWPVSPEDLAPYYEKARQLLDLSDLGWDAVSGWDTDVLQEHFDDPALLEEEASFTDRAYLISPVRMGPKFRETIEDSTNIELFLNTNVVELEATEDATSVSGIRATTSGTDSLVFKARHFVLAAGGIENPRLLLSSK